jgi:hypothetical protein
VTLQQNLERHSTSRSKLSGAPNAGHVTHSARPPGPILQSNFVGRPHLAAIHQTSLQAPHTHWLQDTDSNDPSGSGPSMPREPGEWFRSANAQVDSPHERSTHRPHAEQVDRTAFVQLSGVPPAPHLSTPGISCSSSSPLTRTASYSMHAPRDMPSFGSRPEPGGGHSRAPPFPRESTRGVTHDEQSYHKPTVTPERVPLCLRHTVSAADPPLRVLPSLAVIPTISCGME